MCPIASISACMAYTLAMGPKRVPMKLRLQRLSVAANNGCRIWIGNCLPRGYPLVGKGGHGSGNMYAHRAAYTIAKGPIPDGCDIHHKCGNVRCINPMHLVAIERKRHRMLHLSPICPKGHPFTVENTYLRPDRGTRRCRMCAAKYMHNYYKKGRGK